MCLQEVIATPLVACECAPSPSHSKTGLADVLP